MFVSFSCYHPLLPPVCYSYKMSHLFLSVKKLGKPNLIILGAGPVGLCAAHLLSKTCDVKLIDFAIPHEKPTEFGTQVVSLIKPSLNMLNSIIDLNSVLMQPYSRVKCRVDSSEFAFPVEACILDVASLKYELYRKLPQNVKFIQGKIERIDCTADSVTVICNSDSHHSEMALNTLGKYNVFTSNVKRFDYHEVGIVASLKFTDKNSLGFQRFLPTGPIALLPTGSESASLVWTLPRNAGEDVIEYANNLEKRTNLINLALQNPEYDVDFKLSNLNEDLEVCSTDYIPNVKSVSSFKSFPLGFHHLSECGKERILAIGDAAHSIHPLAGMGLNLGLGDVKSLVSIFENMKTKVDAEKVIENFEKQSHLRSSSMIWACDFMHDIFATRGSFVSFARAVSIKVFSSQSFWSNFMSAKVNKLF
eukprot:NODE_150_length_17275_cov_0.559618.p5 type:complete len:420 gc:universal NODE_150_length_17275_cov_0.559618:7375-8634(+)